MTVAPAPTPATADVEDQVKLERDGLEKAGHEDLSDLHDSGEGEKANDPLDHHGKEHQTKINEENVPPFPWGKYFLLFTVFIANCVAISFLFPIVGFMIMDYGLADNRKEVGYHAGLLLSAFYAGRIGSSTAWGYVSDHWGRKMVIYISVVSSGLLTLLVGLAGSFELALTFRFLSGLMNGQLAVCRVVATEMCHPKHEALGQSFLQVAWLTGLALGPSMSGLVAEPCSEQSFLRGLFDEDSSFCHRPFLLPCVVVVLVHIVALACAWCLPETGVRRCSCHPWLRRYRVVGEADRADPRAVGDKVAASADTSGAEAEGKLVVEGATPTTSEDTAAKPAKVAVADRGRGHWLNAKTLRLIVMHSGQAGIDNMAEGVLSVWCMADLGRAGLGWDASTIGEAYSIAMGGSLCIQLLVGPRIIGCLGPRRTLLWCLFIMAACFALVPQLQLLEQYLGQQLTLAVFALLNCIRQIVTINGFIAIAMFTNSSVDPGHRGRLNGTMVSAQSVLQGAAPAVGGTLFAWASSFSSLGAEVVFLLCTLLTLMNLLLASSLPRSSGSA